MKIVGKIMAYIGLLGKWLKFSLIWVFVLQFTACGPAQVDFTVKHLRDQAGEQITEVVSYEDEAALDNTSGTVPLQVQIEFQRNYRYQINERLQNDEISGQAVRDRIVELYKLPPNDPEGTIQTALCPIVVDIPAGQEATIAVEWTERWAEGVISEGREGNGRMLGTYQVFLGYIEPCSLVGISTDSRKIHPLQPTPTVPLLGRLEATFPLEMDVNDAAIVTVEIIADSQFSELGKHPEFATGKISVQAKSNAGDRGRLEEEVILYPIMSAELVASNFNVSSSSFSPRRRISPTTSAVWMWDITATKAGEQVITINLYGSDVTEDDMDEELVKVISRSIDVYDVSAYSRLFSYLSNNWIAMLGTNGPLALVIVYLTFRFNQKSKQENEVHSQKKQKLPPG